MNADTEMQTADGLGAAPSEMVAVVDVVEMEHVDDEQGTQESGEPCIGIRAKASIRVHLASMPEGHVLIVPIRSGGLWGVERSSDVDYVEEVEAEQREELREIVAAFGLTLP